MKIIQKLEYWESPEGPHRALCKFAGAMFKLYKSRSKFSQNHMFKIYGTIGKAL